jgi:hypothetical protein
VGRGDLVVSAGRLIPRWFAALAIAIPGLVGLGLIGVALTLTGVEAALAWTMAVVASLLAVASAVAFGGRRRATPRTAPGGTVVVDSSPLLWGALLLAWLIAWGFAGLAVWILATDFTAIESPGFTIIAVLALLGSVPDLIRLLTGRLHRWRLELSPEALVYRGYRTEQAIPWRKIRGARIQERGPAGVLVDLKGMGGDLVIPITAFRVPAERLVAEIEQARTAHA